MIKHAEADGAQRDTFDVEVEFERQVRALVDAGYAGEAGMTGQAFATLLEPLRPIVMGALGVLGALGAQVTPEGPTSERVPFVLVVTRALVPADRAMPLTRHKGKAGFVSADTADIDRFVAIEGVQIPDGQAYVVIDVERGAEYLDVRPNDALTGITARGRSPLTVDEGIALITSFPASLEKNHCFSLAASRCGDKRVPAVWISKGAPKLGWCWAGNPHTWLGTASCNGRAGVPAHTRSTREDGA